MTDYWSLSDAEAETALQEFLDERGPALERLHQALQAGGQDPRVLLDESVKSLRPLWAWVKSAVAEAPEEELEPLLTHAPSWLRHCTGKKPNITPESVAVVDGLISYVCRVVERAVPEAEWRVGHKPVKDWVWENHPVLAIGDRTWALGELVQRSTYPIGGRIRSDDNDLALRVKAFIDHMQRAGKNISNDEPLVEVEDLGGHPLRGRELEVALREDIAHVLSLVVDRLVKKLRKEQGIMGVIREDREVLLVATDTWEADRLEDWVRRYLEPKVRGWDVLRRILPLPGRAWRG